MVLDILLKLADLASRALSLVTAILLFINNRPKTVESKRADSK